jgi:hypothetical protein
MVAAKKILACFGAGLLVGWGTSNWVRWAHHQLLQWLWPLGGFADDLASSFCILMKALGHAKYSI